MTESIDLSAAVEVSNHRAHLDSARAPRCARGPRHLGAAIQDHAAFTFDETDGKTVPACV